MNFWMNSLIGENQNEAKGFHILVSKLICRNCKNRLQIKSFDCSHL